MPPNGGYGGNTGIHDGHNLAWKLALVLKGIAGPRAPRDLRGRAASGQRVHRRTGVHALRDADGAVPRASRTSSRWPTTSTSSSATSIDRRAILAEPGDDVAAGQDARASERVARPAGVARAARVVREAGTADLDARPVSRSRSCCSRGPTRAAGPRPCARRRHDSPGFRSRRTRSAVMSSIRRLHDRVRHRAVGRDARSSGRFRRVALGVSGRGSRGGAWSASCRRS